ncbi:hypothetical protein [Rubrivirga sp. IMCC45206]|uniref:hypothetical protein n=1 Tax=Rubrivirga sp. IMCC45206 TaxID=3391614 RepID=UPI00398FFF5F
MKRLLLVGLLLRLVGGLAYLYLIGNLYGGGDYLLYIGQGGELSTSQGAGGVARVWDLNSWVGGRWWGVSFVSHIVGLLFALVGPTTVGGFMAFSMVSYVGIVSLALAFHRTYPTIPLESYLVWIVLFPSLWFWPAALGKDAIVLCGVGLATLGFVGRAGHPRWLMMILGTGLVFGIRPQVAAVLVVCLAAGQWGGAGGTWDLKRLVQSALLIGAGVGAVYLASGQLGFSLFSTDEVEVYFASKSAAVNKGGSALGMDTVSPWMAPVNVLFRPFVWEANGSTVLISAIEILSVWILAWARRRQIAAFIRLHRKTRLFWFGIAFVALYSVALGLSLTNMGIVARQRVHILPFLFLAFAGPSPAAARATTWRKPSAPGYPRAGLSAVQ